MSFVEAISAFGFDVETVRRLSENERDQVPMPDGFAAKFEIGPSVIEGRGVICTSSFVAWEVVGPARISGKRTPLGRFTNHSSIPNAVMKFSDGFDVVLLTIRSVRPGDEIAVDYRQVGRDIQGLSECRS